MFCHSTGGVGGARSRGNQGEPLPTAHVPPSLALHNPTSPHSQGPAEAPVSLHLDKDTTHNSYGNKRWNSYSNLDRAEELSDKVFEALSHDPDVTIDQSRYFKEAEDVDCYRKIALRSKGLRHSSHSVSDVRKAFDSDRREEDLNFNGHLHNDNTKVSPRAHSLSREAHASKGPGRDTVHVHPLRTGQEEPEDKAANMHHYGYSSVYSHKDPLRIGGTSSYDPLYLSSGHSTNSLPQYPSAYRSSPTPPPPYRHLDYSTGYSTMTGTTASLGAGYACSVADTHFTSDLTQWQQHHREQLPRQQLDATQVRQGDMENFSALPRIQIR